MTTPVYAQVKLVGRYADKLRLEAEARRISLNALTSEYAIKGLTDPGPDDDALAGVEKRIVSTILGLRSEIDRLSASVDILAALNDTLAKMLLVHLPEPPSDEREAISASAMGRYEKMLEATARNGFDARRPRAIQRIVELLARDYPDVSTEPGPDGDPDDIDDLPVMTDPERPE